MSSNTTSSETSPICIPSVTDVTQTRIEYAGILILENNKTYGKYKNKNLYKCIPFNKNIPSPIYVPYEMRQIGFSKSFINRYVTFNIIDNNIGTLTNTIGVVSDYKAYLCYTLFNNNFITKQKHIKELENKICENHVKLTNNIDEKYSVEDRTLYNVFSIDGETTKDYDDAIGILTIDNQENHHVISVYIANVPLWLSELKLWSDVENCVSSIYLPDNTINMLPKLLSENICSLTTGGAKHVLAIDFEIKNNIITDVSFKNAKVKIYKNYVYEEWKLLSDKNYKLIFETVKGLTPSCDILVVTSENLIAKLMVLTNYYSAKKLHEHGVGIFKTAQKINEETMETNYGDLPQIFSYWKKCDCKYETGQCNNPSKGLSHDILGLELYTHITSPIRRVVDIINMAQLQKVLRLNELSCDAETFCNSHLLNVDRINTVMKQIKKIQNNAQLLYYFMRLKDENLFEGYVLEKCEKGYLVFIPVMQMVNLVKTDLVMNVYEKRMFKIFVFVREATFKQKIQLQVA